MAKRTTHHLHSEIDFGKVAPDPKLKSDVWWLWLIKGVALLAFGTVALFWPGMTLYVLAYMFSLYLVLSGIVDVIVGIRSLGHRGSWFLKALLGLFEIGIGVYIINHGQTILIATFILLMGLSFIFQGIVELAAYFKSSTDVGSKGWLIFSALLSLIAGIVILRQPVVGGLAFDWILGFYGILGGATRIAVALGIRGNNNKLVV